MKQLLTIDVYFDFICPWCWIGKRNLERAIDLLKVSHPNIQVKRRWHGVQLLPDLPPAGVAYKEFYLKRLGSEPAVRQRQAQVQIAADDAGLKFEFDGIPRMPNTGKAHQMFRACTWMQKQADEMELLLEQLFAVHFVRGRDLGDADLLLTIATACGFDADAVADTLANQAEFISPNRRMVNQVPSYVFSTEFSIDHSPQLSGAQSPQILYQAMVKAIARKESA